MISTQPGGQALASFKILTLDSLTDSPDDLETTYSAGPYGDQDGEQIFVQRVVTDTNTLFIRLASTGERLCTIKSIDNSIITAFYVHECEGSNRMGARRRFLFTGMDNGTVQVCFKKINNEIFDFLDLGFDNCIRSILCSNAILQQSNECCNANQPRFKITE